MIQRRNSVDFSRFYRTHCVVYAAEDLRLQRSKGHDELSTVVTTMLLSLFAVLLFAGLEGFFPFMPRWSWRYDDDNDDDDDEDDYPCILTVRTDIFPLLLTED